MRVENSNVMSVEDAVTKNVDFKVYPNPAHGNMNIRLDDMQGGEALIRIFDMSGRQVYSNATSSVVTNINTSAWAAGMYNVVVSYNNSTAASKVMVQ